MALKADLGMPKKIESSVGLPFEGLLREWFGLGSYEVRTYLALLSGKRTHKEISAVSKVPLPRLYDTLRSLEDKGFVKHTTKGPAPVPPRIALASRSRQLEAEEEERRSKREEAKNQLIPVLTLLSREVGEEGSEVVLMRGLPTIAEHLAEIMSESKEVFLLVRKALEAKDLFLRYVKSLPLSRMKVKVILPANAHLTPEERRLASDLGVELRRHRNPLLDMLVADRRHVIFGVPDPLSENRDAVAVWLRSPSFAKALHESLETLWRESVKS